MKAKSKRSHEPVRLKPTETRYSDSLRSLSQNEIFNKYIYSVVFAIFSIKIFRETKESELQNLLRAKRELEAKLTKHGHSFQDDVETASKMEMSIGNIYTTRTRD